MSQRSATRTAVSSPWPSSERAQTYTFRRGCQGLEFERPDAPALAGEPGRGPGAR